MKYRFDGMQQFSFNISNINHKITISKKHFPEQILIDCSSPGQRPEENIECDCRSSRNEVLTSSTVKSLRSNDEAGALLSSYACSPLSLMNMTCTVHVNTLQLAYTRG